MKSWRTGSESISILNDLSFSKKHAAEMRSFLLNENLDVVQIVPVLAEDYDIDEDYTAKSYGLDVLIKVMGEALDGARCLAHAALLVCNGDDSACFHCDPPFISYFGTIKGNSSFQYFWAKKKPHISR